MNQIKREKPSPLRYSIRTRLILLFFISITIIFVLAGYYLQWQIRATLDSALGQNLEVLALSFAQQIDANFLPFIQPGDETTRTFHNLKSQLQKFQYLSGINRIYIFGKDLRSIVDSDSSIRIGQNYVQLKVNQQEIQCVFQQQTASSVLFEGIDEMLYKTGYAPIVLNNEVIAGLAVEGSADMLHAVTKIQTNLFWLGIVVILGATLLGSFFANRITTPLKKLEAAAAEISRGQLHQPVPEFGRDEVGFLARTLEEMRQNILDRDRQQQAMLAGIAHEIRNPLGGIELFAGLLASEVQNDDLKNYAQKVLKEVKNLTSIIQSFLDYARPAPANKIRCEIKSIWNEAITLLARELQRIKLNFHQSADEIYAFVDPQHLKQVFLNLIKNSVEAIPESGTIFVNIISQEDTVKISFSDSGAGIPVEIADKIFQPFFTTREKGTGLGLAIIKNLIAENGGSIRYVPSNGTGAKFEILLQSA